MIEDAIEEARLLLPSLRSTPHLFYDLSVLRDVGHRLAIRFSRDEVDDVLQMIEGVLEEAGR